jgi:hypothetical protein
MTTPEQEQLIEETVDELKHVLRPCMSSGRERTAIAFNFLHSRLQLFLETAIAAERERLAKEVKAMRQPTDWIDDPDNYIARGYNEAIRDILALLQATNTNSSKEDNG